MPPPCSMQRLASLHELFDSLLSEVPSSQRRRYLEALRMRIPWSALESLDDCAPSPPRPDGDESSPQTVGKVGQLFQSLTLRISGLYGEDPENQNEGWCAVYCFVNQALEAAAADEVAYAVALMGVPTVTAASPTALDGPSSNGPFPADPQRLTASPPQAAVDTAWSLNSAAGLADLIDEESSVSIDVKSIYEGLLSEESKLPIQSELEELLRLGADIFRQESNVVEVPLPAVVVGDIHGQWRDMRERILPAAGSIADLQTGTHYLFLGDFVDRGESGLHVITFLVAAKLLFPDRVFLIRGNHEFRNTNGCYGFLNECHQKYPTDGTGEATTNGSSAQQLASPSAASMRLQGYFGFGGIMLGVQQKPNAVWTAANTLFDQLPVAAVVGKTIFCVHGGLSPKAPHVASIVACPRSSDVASGSGLLGDLTWSDPCEEPGWASNHRGCGHLFGPNTTDAFLERHGFTLLCRAHQCVRGGYLWAHHNRLVTLFSAPNYCGQGNDGAVMKVSEAGDVTFVTYRSSLSFDDEELDWDIPDSAPTSASEPATAS